MAEGQIDPAQEAAMRRADRQHDDFKNRRGLAFIVVTVALVGFVATVLGAIFGRLDVAIVSELLSSCVMLGAGALSLYYGAAGVNAWDLRKWSVRQ